MASRNPLSKRGRELGWNVMSIVHHLAEDRMKGVTVSESDTIELIQGIIEPIPVPP
jgi:hypothetical protein